MPQPRLDLGKAHEVLDIELVGLASGACARSGGQPGGGVRTAAADRMDRLGVGVVFSRCP